MTTPHRFQRHPALRVAPVEGEGVVLHLDTRRYFSVNETGLTLLEALAVPHSFDELVAELVACYEVTAESAERSVREFLDRCLASGLLLIEGAR